MVIETHKCNWAHNFPYLILFGFLQIIFSIFWIVLLLVCENCQVIAGIYDLRHYICIAENLQREFCTFLNEIYFFTNVTLKSFYVCLMIFKKKNSNVYSNFSFKKFLFILFFLKQSEVFSFVFFYNSFFDKLICIV